VIQSLNPLYSPDKKEVVFDESLLGTWGEEGDKALIIFKRPGREMAEFKEKVYVLLFKEERGKAPAEFRAHLVKLGDYLFLDVHLGEDFEGGLYFYNLVPAHAFWNIRVEGDDLHLRALDPEWFWNNQDKLEIDAVYVDTDKEYGGTKRIVLTANPPDLQKFMLEYLEDPKAFKQLGTLHRLPTK
jgi:hypothetical protein